MIVSPKRTGFLDLNSFLGEKVSKKKQLMYIEIIPLNILKTILLKFISKSFQEKRHNPATPLLFF